MRRVLMALTAAGLVAATGIVGYMAGRGRAPAGAEAEAKEEAKAVAKVKVAAARMAPMGKTIVGYGIVGAAREGVHLFSVPFECRVRRFLVTPGQTVASETVLLEVAPSPATFLQEKQAQSSVESATRRLAQARHAATLQKEQARSAVESALKKLAQARHAAALQLQEARAARDAANKMLAQTQRRVDMKLGTAQELLQAQQEAQLAQMRIESLEKLDTTQDVLQAQQDLRLAQLQLESIEKLEATPEVLLAQADLQLAELQVESLKKLDIHTPQVRTEIGGIVNTTVAQEGQIVPAGGALLELAEEKHIEVKLGVEADDITELRQDQPVQIYSVLDEGRKPVEGRVHLITRRVNPSSRLVEVFVALPPDAGLLLESYVRGVVTVATKQALAVPRSAVLPAEDKHVVFTLKDGKAVKHEVATGLEDDTQVELIGDGVKAGDTVVVEGNYELEDGMPVEIESAPAEKPAATKADEKAPAAESEKGR